MPILLLTALCGTGAADDRKGTAAAASVAETQADEKGIKKFEDIPVRIEKWSDGQDGLRIGMQVGEADWRIGGRAVVELWLHNAGKKELTFNCPGMTSPKEGIAVHATDAYGGERSAGNMTVLNLGSIFKLPAGHVTKVKSFTVVFAGPGAPPPQEKARILHTMKAGDYRLSCSWVEGLKPNAPSDWVGTLTAPDFNFTLKDVDENGVPRVPKLRRMQDNAYPGVGMKFGDLPAADILWGKELNGMTAGLRVAKDGWKVGSETKVELWLRNSGAKDEKIQYITRRDFGLRVLMKAADGKEHEAAITKFGGYPFFLHGMLPAGHVFKVREFAVAFLPPGGKCERNEPHFTLAPDQYQFQAELTLPGTTLTDDEGFQVTPAEGEWSGTLTSGDVAVKLVPAGG